VRLVELLHVHGADISATDQHGATPLHYATLMCAQHHHHHHHQQQQQQLQQLQQQRDDDDFGQWL